MEVQKKFIEIFMKMSKGEYTRFDEMEDFATAVIELSITNLVEKEKAKLMIKTAREIAEKNIRNNN